MQGTITTQSITFYRTAEAAQRIADASTYPGDEWTYTVDLWERGFVVMVRDEDGFDLGTL